MSVRALAALAVLAASPTAFAQDEPAEAEQEIISVPAGSELKLPGKPVLSIGFQSYLLPEPHYDTALSASMNLPICKSSLTFCQGQSEWALTEAQRTFALARDQFASDEDQVSALTQQVVELDADLIRSNGKLSQAKTQRNVAWAITGGLILGAVAVTAVAVGN